MSILKRLKVRHLLLIGGILLLCLLVPQLGRVIFALVLIGLVLYLIYKSMPDIIEKLKIYIQGRQVKIVRTYVDYEQVRLRQAQIEIGLGQTLARLDSTWFQVVEISAQVPDEVYRIVRSSNITVLVSLNMHQYIIVRDEDPERVLDTCKYLCTILDMYNVQYRILSSEEAIKTIFSLFRT